MEIDDLAETLETVGYTIKRADLEIAVTEGAKSMLFTKLVSWITKEIKLLCSLDEQVEATTSAEDVASFLMELSSFLSETGCQYDNLTDGPISGRLRTLEDKILLLNYLLIELKAARMISVNKTSTDGLQVSLNESRTANGLKKIMIALKHGKPLEGVNITDVSSKILQDLNEKVKKLPNKNLGKPMMTETLSVEQWNALLKVQQQFHREYKIRREMLLKRLNVTIKSFQWTERKVDKAEIERLYNVGRASMSVDPNIVITDVLVARNDLCVVEKTSSASVRSKTKSDVNKVIIGVVPDRGGRPNEQEAPPPEMPSWKQRSAANTGGRGGQNRGGPQGHRGGAAYNARDMGNRGRGNFERGGSSRDNRTQNNYGPQDTNNAYNRDYGRNDGGYAVGGRVQGGWNNNYNRNMHQEDSRYQESSVRGGHFQDEYEHMRNSGNRRGNYQQGRFNDGSRGRGYNRY